eukprot:1697030-Amphidinium_carterae.1
MSIPSPRAARPKKQRTATSHAHVRRGDIMRQAGSTMWRRGTEVAPVMMTTTPQHRTFTKCSGAASIWRGVPCWACNPAPYAVEERANETMLIIKNRCAWHPDDLADAHLNLAEGVGLECHKPMVDPPGPCCCEATYL